MNVDVLRDALEWATVEHEKQLAGKPSEWDQEVWIEFDELPCDQDDKTMAEVASGCGTACCLAGRIVLRALGDRIRWDGDSQDWTLDGDFCVVPDAASDVLNCPDLDRLEDLFSSTNSIFDLWRISERLTNGKLEMPAALQIEHALRVRARAERENVDHGATVAP